MSVPYPECARHGAYRKAFDLLHDTPARDQDRSRVPLPLCVVILIRQAWPDQSGVYTGYQEDLATKIPRRRGYGSNWGPGDVRQNEGEEEGDGEEEGGGEDERK